MAARCDAVGRPALPAVPQVLLQAQDALNGTCPAACPEGAAAPASRAPDGSAAAASAVVADACAISFEAVMAAVSSSASSADSAPISWSSPGEFHDHWSIVDMLYVTVLAALVSSAGDPAPSVYRAVASMH